MTLHTPSFMQPVTGDPAINDSAQEFRQFARATLTAADGVGGTQGVTSASSFAVAQRGAGANFSVDVSSGLAYVLGDDVTNQGTYVCWNDGTVNVPTPSPPGSGTDVYRLVLQVQDKLNNGTWTGYTAALQLLPAASGGGPTPPPEPNSAITLAFISIATGQVSVQNANITDYRQRVGQVAAARSADLPRAHATTLTDDPTLQLLNLAASATYELGCLLFYTGGSGANEGDLAWTWRLAGGVSMNYSAHRLNAGGSVVVGTGAAGTDTLAAQTQGTGTLMAVNLAGTIVTGAAPAYAVLQWAQNTDNGTATTMKANSYVRARRLT